MALYKYLYTSKKRYGIPFASQISHENTDSEATIVVRQSIRLQHQRRRFELRPLHFLWLHVGTCQF